MIAASTARRSYLILAACALAWRIATAAPIQQAGYMDASYTLHVGSNLAQGRGLTEQLLWNYLDNPTGLPHPSNLYWLPLPALLAAGGYTLFGLSYRAAQLPFVLLSVVPPLFAFYLAQRIFARPVYSWMAGLLALFSGFYTVYWVAPDNFTPFAVTADAALLLIGLVLACEWAANAKPGAAGGRRSWLLCLAAGVFIGLSQLARADAFLLMAALPVALFLFNHSVSRTAQLTTAAVIGTVLVLAPWLARNYLAVGSVMPPGGARTLFLTNYEELFRLHVEDLTLSRYLAWGVLNIMSSKLRALGFDLLVLAFGGFIVFLAPFGLIGLWQLRRRAEFTPFLIYLGLLVAAMVFLFTFPGMRGSMLHSSAALVPYFAVAVPPGLDAAIRGVARRRRQWNERSAQRFFRLAFVGLAAVLSLFLYGQGVFGNVIGGTPSEPLWNERDQEYAAVAGVLDARAVPRDEPVLTVDPPSFANRTGRPSIITPTDSMEALLEAADLYGARYVVLQNDHPRYFNALYDGGDAPAALTQVAAFRDAAGRPVMLFEITRP